MCTNSNHLSVHYVPEDVGSVNKFSPCISILSIPVCQLESGASKSNYTKHKHLMSNCISINIWLLSNIDHSIWENSDYSRRIPNYHNRTRHFSWLFIDHDGAWILLKSLSISSCIFAILKHFMNRYKVW